MAKKIFEPAGDIEVEIGLNWTRDRFSFKVLSPHAETPGTWNVLCSSLSASFRRGKQPRIIPMTDVEILQMHAVCMIQRANGRERPQKEEETIFKKLSDGAGMNKLRAMYAQRHPMQPPGAFAA